MWRHVAGVVVGYLFFGITSVLLFRVSGFDPEAAAPLWFMALSTLAGIVFAGAAGFFASIISPFGSRAAWHLAAVVAAIGVVFLVTQWSRGAIWSEVVTILVLGAP
jgi:hypothetical protein